MIGQAFPPVSTYQRTYKGMDYVLWVPRMQALPQSSDSKKSSHCIETVGS